MKGFVFSLLKLVFGHFSTMNWWCFKLKRFPLQKKSEGRTYNSVSYPLWVTQAAPHLLLPLTQRPCLRNHKVSTALSSRLHVAWRSWRGTSLKEEGPGLSSRITSSRPGSYSGWPARQYWDWAIRSRKDSCCLKSCAGPLPEVRLELESVPSAGIPATY